MSRIGKQPVTIPSGVEVRISDRNVVVKGPKGELSRDFSPLRVGLSQEDSLVQVNKDKANPAAWGLARALLHNMMTGVSTGFTKSLEIHGVGYRASVSGTKLTLELGFSHPVVVELPKGVEAKVQKNVLTFAGTDKQVVGDVASRVRKIRPPEPYKGTGLRYVGEHVRQKEGKKAAGEGAGGGA